MITTDLCVIGAGPAGLAAAIEAAKQGVSVTIIDENIRAGGQLFKQIHKFFGSKEHHAGVRGFDIGEKLLKEAGSLGVDIRLRTAAYGIFEGNKIGIHASIDKRNGIVDAKKVIIATGGMENSPAFSGWTLPGVMGAGAAQTLANLYGIKPGEKAIMVGSGNVGLIVSYQLMQSGVEVVALVEAANKISGYLVHARKLLRAGVPIYLSATVKEAIGTKCVEKAILISNNGTELELEADTICIATGLSPLSELASMAGCAFSYNKTLGGFVPLHDRNMKTSNDDIYVAGDVSGIEEASTAMEEGRIAGISVAQALNKLSNTEAEDLIEKCYTRLNQLREGSFGAIRQTAKEALFKEAKDVT
ncbi:MAG: NAD(P)/FAD-dependent oxidoreductase [Defluviitaleaceae bacterium]|nr:NAD(P)/FAD-dependent oxidoreductase [Defluviitaleaceae bacterium]